MVRGTPPFTYSNIVPKFSLSTWTRQHQSSPADLTCHSKTLQHWGKSVECSIRKKKLSHCVSLWRDDETCIENSVSNGAAKANWEASGSSSISEYSNLGQLLSHSSSSNRTQLDPSPNRHSLHPQFPQHSVLTQTCKSIVKTSINTLMIIGNVPYIQKFRFRSPNFAPVRIRFGPHLQWML